VDRTHKELSDEEIVNLIARTYHAWRGEAGAGEYQDVPGFCKSATLAEITANGYTLSPGRYVGAEEVENGSEIFEDKITRLVKKLEEQFTRSKFLENVIQDNLQRLLDI
jgi:type I restriction enzyme M protein